MVILLARLKKNFTCRISKGGAYAYNIIKRIETNTKAMGTIEVVLIVAILVALALLFKGFVNEYAEGIFTNIREKTNDAFTNWQR